MQPHRLGVAPRQDQAGSRAALGADGAEDVGRCSALVLRRRRSAAASCPTPGDLVLLANSGFVGEPNLYGVGCDTLLTRDFIQTGWESLWDGPPLNSWQRKLFEATGGKDHCNGDSGSRN
jgi:hypothetical protein